MTSVVYIGGTGRSGSTLLARLLAEVPQLVVVGELRYVLERGYGENHLCGCGQPFRSCPFWQRVIARALPEAATEAEREALVQRIGAASRLVDRNRFIPSLLHRSLRRREFTDSFAVYARFLERLYAAVAEVSGAAVVVDSSKDPSYAFVLNALDGVDLTVLHLVRDSRAVAFSWTREKVRPEVQSHVAHMAKRRPAKSAALWSGYNLLFHWLSRHVARYRRMRYEDFVANPDASFADLVAWLDLPAAPPTRAAHEVHDISGNPLRFSPAPLRVSLDDEWTSELAASDRRVVEAFTAPLLRFYGYRRRGA